MANKITRDIMNMDQELCTLIRNMLCDCIKDAMETEHGQRAYEVLKELDSERVRLLRENEKPALPILPEQDGFDRLDLAACAKIFNYLPEVQALMCKRFVLTEYQCGLAKYIAKAMLILRNLLAQTAQ